MSLRKIRKRPVCPRVSCPRVSRNNDGETPIFTTVDDAAIPLFIKYGADLTIRNKQGQTVFEAANEKGPQRQRVLREAMQHPDKN